MRGGSRTVAVLSLLAATLFWSGNYIVGAAAVQTIEPTSLVLLRWSIAAIPLIALAWAIERPNWRDVLRAWPWLIALSICGLLGYNLLLYFALEHTDAFSASLINAFNPALIALASAILLRQRLTPSAVAGIAVALAGVLLVLGNGDITRVFRVGFGWGEAGMIGAIVAWTAYTIIGRRAPRIPPITSTAVQAVLAVAMLLPFTLLTGGVDVPDSVDSFSALLYIAVFPSILSYVLWNRALEVIPPARAGVFLNLITVFTALLTALLGHPMTLAQIIGGVIILGGVVLANGHPPRSRGRAPDTMGS